jgi:predicted DNA-binding transcriptional regulator YafY
MPVNKDALSRYRWIDERLRNKRLPPPTLEDLIDYVSEKMGKPVPTRTLQYDLTSMRHSEELNYHAPIAYNKAGKYYHYTEEDYSISNMPVSEFDLQGLEIAIGILEQFQKLPVIRQFEDAILKIAAALKINREHLEHRQLIRLDAPPQYKGLEWIQDIATAMKEHEMLRIAYQSFERNEPKEYWIEPYHLREYNNRFYVMGKSVQDKGKSKEGRLLTFGLDRIIDIWPTGQHFDEKNFDEANYFKNAVGITVHDQQPEKITLSFTPHQAKYIKSSPLHASQKILKDTAQECVVELELIINHELMMILLSYGAQVKILKPRHLSERIRQEAADMLKQYE